MIFVDFNNVCTMRYALAQKEVFKESIILYKKTKSIDIVEKNYKDLRKGFFNLIIKELAQYQKQHTRNYGEIIIASDYKKSNYWRKTIHPRYKESRDKAKSNSFEDAIWKNFNKDKNDLVEIIKLLGFVVLDKVQHTETKESVEADDIIGVLVRTPGKHLIISSDGDFDQLTINPNIRRYNLLEAKMVKKSIKDIHAKNLESLVLGQAKDDIPNIKFESELSDDFIEWMDKKYNIQITPKMIYTIKEKYQNYMKEYKDDKFKEDTQLIASGKRKQRRNLSAFKKPNFGKFGFADMLQNQGIEKLLLENPIYAENYELNKKLYLLENIPQRIIELIGKSFLSEKRNVSSNKYEAEKMFYENSIDILLLSEFF